jgi:hypothetical protein
MRGTAKLLSSASFCSNQCGGGLVEQFGMEPANMIVIARPLPKPPNCDWKRTRASAIYRTWGQESVQVIELFSRVWFERDVDSRTATFAYQGNFDLRLFVQQFQQHYRRRARSFPAWCRDNSMET